MKPDNTLYTKLGVVAYVTMGQAPPGDTYNEEQLGLPLIAGAGDLGDTYPQPKRWTTNPSQTCLAGDIIICVRATIGVMNWADRIYTLGRGVASIHANENLIEPEYLYYCLLTNVEKLTKAASGSTFIQIKRQDIENLQIPLPPLPEQRRIAAILREADEIRQLRRQANEKAQKIVESLFYDMFGDPATNPKKWEVLKIEDLTSKRRKGITTGPFGSLLKRSELVDEGIPVWGINNVHPNEFFEAGASFITPEKYKQLTAYTVQEGDILISRAGTVGRICVAYPPSSPSIISTNLVRVVLDSSRIHPEYFTALFTHFMDRLGKLRASGEEGSYSFLNPGTLRSLQVPVPPLALQNKFVAFLLKIREGEKLQNQFYQCNSTLYQSLLAQAFSGELTASWREAHFAELAEAAEERDRLLEELRLGKREAPPQEQEPDKGQVTKREELKKGLTELQHALLRLIDGQRESYVTGSGMHEDIWLHTDEQEIYQEALDREEEYHMFAGLDCSLDTIRRELHFLAHMGIIKELALPVEEEAGAGIVHYITAYRSLRQGDDCRQQDLGRLNADLAEGTLV